MITPAYAPTATERVLPRLALDFTTGTLDPRVTVTRALNTATAVNSSGNIAIVNANLPRFDYDPVTLLPKGILIEESRANIAVYSNDVTGTGWTLGGLTTSTPTTSPDGTANAVLLLEDNSTGFHRAFQVPTTTAAAWTVSGYFKPNGRDWIWLRMSDSGGIKYAWFNITTGVTGTVQSGLTANIYPSKNGFYRCTITAATAAAGAAAVIFGTADADNSNSFAGDITKGIYFYGLQVELGAFVTSYIPTTTTSLTRNADLVTMTGTNFSDWFNATVSGSVTASATVMGGSNNTIYTFDNTASGLYADLVKAATNHGGVTGRVTFVTTAAGATTYIDDRTGQTTNNTRFNTAFTFANSKFASTTNAATPFTQASGAVPAAFNILRLGSHRDGTILNGWLSKFAYYAPLFTSAETQAFSK